MLDACNDKLSAEIFVRPEPMSLPPTPVELRQPCPEPGALLFAHGQLGVPSPKQKGVPPLTSHSSGTPFAFRSWLV